MDVFAVVVTTASGYVNENSDAKCARICNASYTQTPCGVYRHKPFSVNYQPVYFYSRTHMVYPIFHSRSFAQNGNFPADSPPVLGGESSIPPLFLPPTFLVIPAALNPPYLILCVVQQLAYRPSRSGLLWEALNQNITELTVSFENSSTDLCGRKIFLDTEKNGIHYQVDRQDKQLRLYPIDQDISSSRLVGLPCGQHSICQS
ncbi:hypothetical protein BDV59DRAFT_176963 [Aspergillus ambiguus]|uniref:uncharacterized protein n=1 Tax=Aspergillus ambiguus TaxID=176160 RepID=UPI003CCD9DC4